MVLICFAAWDLQCSYIFYQQLKISLTVKCQSFQQESECCFGAVHVADIYVKRGFAPSREHVCVCACLQPHDRLVDLWVPCRSKQHPSPRMHNTKVHKSLNTILSILSSLYFPLVNAVLLSLLIPPSAAFSCWQLDGISHILYTTASIT